jgi:hypothetical protein
MVRIYYGEVSSNKNLAGTGHLQPRTRRDEGQCGKTVQVSYLSLVTE